jgi:hypothetical protein
MPNQGKPSSDRHTTLLDAPTTSTPRSISSGHWPLRGCERFGADVEIDAMLAVESAE